MKALATGEALERPAIVGGTPIRPTFLVFGRPALEETEIQEVMDTLRSGWIGTGPKVSRFEDQFKAYKQVPYAMAVNSCTAALHLSLLAMDIGAGDEVITTPMTFCASVNAVLHAGATPVFADCDKESMNIDAREIEKHITSKTKAILLVHFAGRPCEMDAILAVAQKHQLKVVEDCAHAIETEYHGRKVGSMGDVGCFSFYVTKNVTTGEGGMVTTANKQLEERIKRLALHGMSKDAWKRFSDTGYKHYSVMEAGFKYNMTDLQASLGLHQLARAEKNWLKRKSIWERYQSAFKNLPCILPAEPEPNTRHAYHLYTLLVDTERLSVSRDFLLDAFVKENIGVGVHYVSLNHHEFYQKAVSNGSERFPNSEFISERTLSLPLSPALTDSDVTDVISAVRRLLNYYKKTA